MNAEEFGNSLKEAINPRKCREKLIGSEYLSDVTLTFDDQREKLKAHKLFLMTASPVLHQIFSTESSSDGNILEIKIEEISKPTMIEICRFAYSENVNFNQHNMLHILAAASKLQMDFLVEMAFNYIRKEGVNKNTVFKILEANQKHKKKFIYMDCFECIERNHQTVFRSKDFLQMSSELIRMMLKACKLPQIVAKEAIDLWSANHENADHDIDDLISSIYSNKSQFTPLSSPYNLELDGNFLRKTFQVASLYLLIGSKPIVINVVKFFVSNRSKDDQEMKLEIIDMTSIEKLFSEIVYTNDLGIIEYVLPQACRVDAGKEILIRIEFQKAENRMSLENCTVAESSTPDGLALVPVEASDLGQTILSIGYDEV